MKKIQIFIAIFIALSFGACRSLVSDVFPDFETVPAVNSFLVEGEPLSVLVSMTGKIDSLPLPVVNDAIIDLYIDGEFGGQLENTGSGNYTSNTIIRKGKEYRCRITIPNRDTIVCKQTLPEPNPIIKIQHINIAGRNQEGTTYPAIKFTFKNDITERRYYEVDIKCFIKHPAWKYEDEYMETLSANILTITDPVLLNEGLPIALFSNEIIDDSVYTMTLNYSGGGSSSQNGGPWRTNLHPLIIELRSVTYDYYRYKKQYYLYNEGRWADGLTNTNPPSPLYSNIENGYGIFAGYSVFFSDTITPEPYDN
jgi:hypothetical protein